MAIFVKGYKVNFGGKIYAKGQEIKGLPENEKNRLMKAGFIEEIGSTEDVVQEDQNKSVSDMTVQEGQELIQKINDVKILEQMLVEEGNHKDRKGILAAIEDRIDELKE